jgi:hypothetical protein
LRLNIINTIKYDLTIEEINKLDYKSSYNLSDQELLINMPAIHVKETGDDIDIILNDE